MVLKPKLFFILQYIDLPFTNSILHPFVHFEHILSIHKMVRRGVMIFCNKPVSNVFTWNLSVFLNIAYKSSIAILFSKIKSTELRLYLFNIGLFFPVTNARINDSFDVIDNSTNIIYPSNPTSSGVCLKSILPDQTLFAAPNCKTMNPPHSYKHSFPGQLNLERILLHVTTQP
ncbi:MAG: hypothetical protein QM786_04105 [Breznakibacter sp.]